MQIQAPAALVTGGGSSLGEATAGELARLGAKVALLDVNRANAARVAAGIGGVGVACGTAHSHTHSLQTALAQAAAARSVTNRQLNGEVIRLNDAPR